MDSSHNFFATSVPGTESMLEKELLELGVRQTVLERGGVSWQGSRTDAESIARNLHSASSLLLRVGSFKVTALSELVKKTSYLPWADELTATDSFAVRVSCFRSKIYHSTAAAERIRNGIELCLGGSGKGPATRKIIADIEHNICRLSISIGQTELHQHGYRLETAKAPLREDLAASLLYACDWSGDSPLIDPFCGSGTIPIEAARLALRRGFSPEIIGFDRDAGAVRISKNNAERAGLPTAPDFSCHAVSDLTNRYSGAVSSEGAEGTQDAEGSSTPAVTGLILSNPPYGRRVNSSRDLRNLYARFGTVLRDRFPGWKAGILCTAGTEGDILLGQMGLKFRSVLHFSNGGLPVSLRLTEMPE